MINTLSTFLLLTFSDKLKLNEFYSKQTHTHCSDPIVLSSSILVILDV